MAKYKAYPEYKDSGVEWLGAIPEHWVCTQVKYGYEVTLGKMLQKNKSSPSDELKPYLKAQNIQPHGIDLNHVDLMWFSYEERKKLLLRYNDVLVSEGGDVGRSAIWSGQLVECYIQNAINRVRPINNNSSIFFNYWITYLKSIDFISTLCNKATIAHYTAEKLETSPLLLPKFDEQLSISAFLDHETAKIDNLIEKQQQLIELLKEKRQAVISHAVTKGLNPDVPMKDSGVEWLGEVPEHWDIIRLKYLINTFEQGWSPQCEARLAEENEYGVLKVGCVNSGDFNPLEHKALPSNLKPQKQYLVKKNDLLISRANTKELVGSSAVVEKDFDNLILCDKLYRLIFRNSVNPYFISEFIRTPMARKQIELSASGASHSMQNIGQDTIKELFIALPPEYETQELMVFIKNEINIFNSLIDLSHRQVKFLQERRTALISAAVTGKIDVRNWVAPDTSDIEATEEATV